MGGEAGCLLGQAEPSRSRVDELPNGMRRRPKKGRYGCRRKPAPGEGHDLEFCFLRPRPAPRVSVADDIAIEFPHDRRFRQPVHSVAATSFEHRFAIFPTVLTKTTCAVVLNR